ncbi:hypothetical protein CBER1_11409 [Cercospora berteroae]|uniref:Uncharacterized protein n=1 Tax=Cercospora berteroae TaxID=357750 RepID=A0A2S6BZM1_9PEZI|nr:hypothetical protein CBER1_11409 [Cercospora berteroae]
MGHVGDPRELPTHMGKTPTSIYANPNVDDIARNNPTAERDGHLIPETDETGYRIREQPYGTKREVKVVIMGAGASTLNFLKKAEEQMENLKITVYEKNHDKSDEVAKG